MTTIDTTADAAAEAASGDATAGSAASSFFATAAAWVTTTDHKRIGRLYVGVGLLGLLAAAVLGGALGIERADDGDTLFVDDALLQMFQTYRVGLVFAALIPLALGLAIAVTPLQLGARSIAFPRLALLGFYSWLGGLVLTLFALGRNGGIGGGDRHMVDLFLAGHGLMILGLLASAGCVATSVLTTRAPGMTMRRVPLFAWSTLIGALGMLLALPVVFGAIVYLFVDHRLGISANFGGAEGISSWIGYTFSTPAVVVFALPAIGVGAELVPVTFQARQAVRGVAFAGIALVGVTALAATTQQFVHDVTFDTDGQTFVEDAIPYLVFNGLPVLGLLVVMGLGALTAKNGLSNGRPRLTSAFVLGFLGMDLVATGVLASALNAITDLELIGTSFEEGATLLVVYGTMFGVIGGLAFWAPKLWGRVVPPQHLLPLAVLGLLGALLAAVPLLIAGVLGQSGGVPSNDADVARLLSLDFDGTAQLWQVLSVVGHGLVVLTVLGFIGLMMLTATDEDEAADDNPFGGHTVEWGTSSPAPADNYEHVPTVASPEPQFDTTDEGSPS